MQYSELNKKEWFDYVISEIEIFKAEIEWTEPLDYQILLDRLIRRLREKANE